MQAELIPPAPRPTPVGTPAFLLLGRTMSNVLLGFTEDAYEAPVVTGRMLGQRYVLVSDPVAARRVLADQWPAYPKTAIMVRLLRPFTGEGLLLAEGEAWCPQRRRLAPLFTPGSVGTLTPHLQAAAEQLVVRLGVRETVDLADAFDQTALDAVMRALFSRSVQAGGERLIALARGYLRGGDRAGRVTLSDLFARRSDDYAWTPAAAARRRFSRRWFAEIDALIAERRAGTPAERGGDLLDLLLSARDAATGERLSDSEVRSQAATFVAAGYETTARLLFWAAYLLARVPEEQDRVREEVHAAPFEPGAGLDHLHRWPRLRAVLLETLRLYPSVPMMTRMAREPDTLAGVEIAPGDQVSVSPWVMHRHRRLWDAPEVFRANRFEGKFNAHLTEPAFIPFGVGPRICIGATLALAEASLVLAALLAAKRLSLADARPPMPVANLSLAPDRAPLFRLERA